MRTLLPSWLLLWLAVPLPGQLDNQLVASMQRLVSSSASQVLEILGVLHSRSGDVLEVGGRQLLVEEACSGIHSLLPVLACTLFWLGWRGRPLAHCILLLLTVLPWVLLGNVARIVAVAMLDGLGGINLSAGWGHEALGYVVFAAMLGLMWSTEQWLLFLTPLTARPVDRLNVRKSRFAKISKKPRQNARSAGKRRRSKPVLRQPGPPAWRTMVLTSWPVLMGFGLLAVSQGALIKQSLAPVTLPVSLPRLHGSRPSKLSAKARCPNASDPGSARVLRPRSVPPITGWASSREGGSTVRASARPCLPSITPLSAGKKSPVATTTRAGRYRGARYTTGRKAQPQGHT